MLGVNLCVGIISYSLETDARCEAVAKRMEIPLLVYSTDLYGIRLSKSKTNQVLQAFGMFYNNNQLKDNLGSIAVPTILYCKIKADN